MQKNTTWIGLFAACLLLSIGQAATAEIPFIISYYDNTWESIPLGEYALGEFYNHIDPGETQGYTTLAACGMNVVNSSAERGINLDLAQANGLLGMVGWDYGDYDTPVIPYDPAFINTRAQSLASQFGSHPAHLGYRLRDEPSADEWPAIGLMHQKLLQYDPDSLPWVNLLPNFSYGGYGTGVDSHKQYLDSFISQVQPKVLCYDEYSSAYNSTYPENFYSEYLAYSNLERFREYSLDNNIPFWRILESNLALDSDPRTPSLGKGISPNTEGIYRQQIFTSLAYGATGILYFTYTEQAGTQALVYGQHTAPTPGVDWGKPTANGRYKIAQEVNHEVMKLAPTLMKLTSWSVHHTDYNAYSMSAASAVYVHPDDVETFNGIDGYYVTNITGGDMVYGTFIDDTYRSYFMFVNKDYVNGHSFSIQFDTSHAPAIGKVSKDTGRVIPKSTPGGVLSKWFDAGDGELYKILYDTSAASTPAGLNAVDETFTSIDIDWSNSYDAQSGIDYYVVYRNGVEIDTVASSYFVDTGLLSGTSYSYRVSAVNGEDIESSLSSLIWASTVSLPGDANRDGIVDDVDATLLATNWLTMSGATWDDGDFNGDGKVDEVDASILAANWQVGASSSSSVPEPGMMVLLVGMLLLLAARKRN